MRTELSRRQSTRLHSRSGLSTAKETAHVVATLIDLCPLCLDTVAISLHTTQNPKTQSPQNQHVALSYLLSLENKKPATPAPSGTYALLHQKHRGWGVPHPKMELLT